ncbi:hypothetical protein F5050DRAFT_1898768 [Lentinula boryana]|uniref:Uncharacterized protein n=1 Tax=Lentinula boryana TaxID=40481 RepID=A0ABQ8PZ23_9AGAR|nr:hypothetical protein F5050DRAFT_1898768 [Lentinula boryana]
MCSASIIIIMVIPTATVFPNTAAPNYRNMTAPPFRHLAWSLIVPYRIRFYDDIVYLLEANLPLAPLCGYSMESSTMNMVLRSTLHPRFPAPSPKSNTDLKDGESEKLFGNNEIIGWPEDMNKRRKVLIVTLEYKIIDWKLKVKIGGLGVMSSLMGKAMTEVDSQGSGISPE